MYITTTWLHGVHFYFRTPLHLSIQNGNASIFTLLLRHSSASSLEIKNSDGLPPMWYALKRLQDREDESKATQARGQEIISQSVPPDFFATELVSAGTSPNTVRRCSIAW